VVEPLVVGGAMTLALLAESAAAQPAAPAPSIRERMQARARGMTAPLSAAQAPRSATAGIAAATSTAGEAASRLLSTILGRRADTPKTSELSDIFNNAPLVERNVDAEMDAHQFLARLCALPGAMIGRGGCQPHGGAMPCARCAQRSQAVRFPASETTGHAQVRLTLC